MKHIINKRIAYIDSLCIHICLSMNTKDTSFSKKKQQNINEDRLLGILCLLGKKHKIMFCHKTTVFSNVSLHIPADTDG